MNNTWARFDAPTQPQPGVPQEEAPTVRRRGGIRRMVLPVLLGSSFLVGALSGGAVGGVAAARWLAGQPTPVTSAQDTVAPEQSPAQTTTQRSPAAAPVSQTLAGEVFRKVNPSVVQVVVSGSTSRGLESGAGSGFVIDGRGYLLTNQHVVQGARVVGVRFSNGATREAQVVGTDGGNDLALLKVDLPEGIPAATLGDSDSVGIGDLSFVIGSPFGLDQSLTQGIISAVHRTWTPGDARPRRDLLQTDAAVNPGNSGGPLLNAAGEVVGITSMIESPVRGNVGVGFAIPINTTKRVLPQLEKGANLVPVWLGITGQPLDAGIARDQNIPVQEGVLVLTAVPEGPAARAGLRGGQAASGERIPRGGDVIVAVDEVPVKDLGQITDSLVGRNPGDPLKLTIIRNGERRDLSVTLQQWPSS